MSSTSTSISSTLLYIQQQIIRYVCSFFLTFGVAGCCLNILLLSRRHFHKASCCTYFLAMSITMVVHLSWGLGVYLYTLDHVDPTTTVLAMCKLRTYILQYTSMIYRWCLAAACFDRYALSAVDVRLRNFARVHIARRVIAGIISLWLVLPVHILIFYDLKGPVCGIVYSTAAAFYHSIFTTVTGGVLPVVIMIACAILIHRNLVLKRQRRQVLVSQVTERINNREISESRRDQQVLIMLLVQVLIYFIMITPLMCVYFYNAITLNIQNKSPDRIAIERFASFIAEQILFAFPVSSFYLYTMSSSMFRAEIMIMARSVLTCKGPNNAVAVGSTTNEYQLKAMYGRLSHVNPALNCIVPSERAEAVVLKPTNNKEI